MDAPQCALVAAVPQLASYQGHSGIKRVFQSLRAHWPAQIRLVDASFAAYPLPILRNFPFGVRASSTADLVLLPQLTGAQALRDTSGLPGVVVVHDIGIVDFPGDRDGMDWLSYRSILRSFWSLRHAALVIAVSGWTRERLLHYLPELAGRVQVVPSGVDALFLDYARSRSEARSRIAQRLGGTLHEPLLLYVGSETPRKNMPLLLDAFKRVKDFHPEAQLLKVGAAGDRRWRTQTLAQAQRLGLRLGSDLLLLDHVDDAALADAYRAADLFVSASSYEGFGLPPLEAMACGTPVVVTRCGAFAEVVGDSGWLVPDEAEPFAQAIDQALNPSERATRSQTARRRAREFTWQRAAAQYAHLLGKVAGAA
jgi:glycosyltransferase involved in cell wall biosynthesis